MPIDEEVAEARRSETLSDEPEPYVRQAVGERGPWHVVDEASWPDVVPRCRLSPFSAPHEWSATAEGIGESICLRCLERELVDPRGPGAIILE